MKKFLLMVLVGSFLSTFNCFSQEQVNEEEDFKGQCIVAWCPGEEKGSTIYQEVERLFESPDVTWVDAWNELAIGENERTEIVRIERLPGRTTVKMYDGITCTVYLFLE